jgi:N-hydroxyarylamine O-acetyltransferase
MIALLPIDGTSLVVYGSTHPEGNRLPMSEPKVRPDASGLDLDAYLERIGYSGGLAPSRSTLDALHLAHATHIPFENLDILLGLPIRLDLPSLAAKLVRGRRGGYCFEQNRLFAAVLEALGFAVTPLAARVRFGTTAVLPRTHMTLLVELDGERLLADVGFGAHGLLLPVPFGGAIESRQFAWTYRVVAAAAGHVLQSRTGEAWSDLYAFTQEPQQPVDFDLANYYTSTHPASRFVQTLTAQRLAPEVRRVLRDRDYSELRGDEVVRRTLASDDEVLAVLADAFALRLPPGTRFRARGAPG